MHNRRSSILDSLRHRNRAGKLIGQHRALSRLELQPARWLHPLLLPISFTVLTLMSLREVGRFWTACLEFWVHALALPATVSREQRWPGSMFQYELPYVNLAARYPTDGDLALCTILVLLIMLLSYLLLRRSLPVAYIVWGLSLIQLTSVGYFVVQPANFPYTIATHVRGGLEMSVALALIIPWILAPTYYSFTFALHKKIFATVLMLAHIVLFAPLQYMFHANLVYDLSLLVMPLLFVMGGLFVNIVVFIALYGWAMSWERVSIT